MKICCWKRSFCFTDIRLLFIQDFFIDKKHKRSNISSTFFSLFFFYNFITIFALTFIIHTLIDKLIYSECFPVNKRFNIFLRERLVIPQIVFVDRYKKPRHRHFCNWMCHQLFPMNPLANVSCSVLSIPKEFKFCSSL